jgi:hypothetical protein
MCRPLQRNHQSQLKRHVETWSAWNRSINLHPREIVNRILRLLNQRENAVESPLPKRYF